MEKQKGESPLGGTSVSDRLALIKDEIFLKWENMVRKHLPVVSQIDSNVLRNALPKLLDELIMALADPEPTKRIQAKEKSLGREHGKERSQLRNYDLNNVIEEYQILRHVIFDELRKYGELSAKDQDVILDAITVGIRNSTVEFTKIKQEQFANAVLEAETANAAKNSFLVHMSHEIRTPMTSILGFIELLREPGISEEERQDAISRIENSGRALLRLIDDVLDFSKIEAGKLINKMETFSPTEVVSDVIAAMELTAKQKGITLKLEVDSSTPTTANSDPARIRQILVNVIGNAIKFTDSGEVLLRIKAESNHILQFDLYDTGIGISEDDQEKLFQPFAQADASITRRFGGTGLGLALSRRLAESLNGSLRLVSSTPDKGSWFSCRIEAAPFGFEKPLSQDSVIDSKISLKTIEPQLLKGLRILLAEDTQNSQILIARFLTLAGAEVQLANDGEEAIEMASHTKFDIILMDIQMPKLDGIQATQRLRSMGYNRPILALTAHALKEEVRRSINAGYNAHLTKPITKAVLISSILKYASQNPEALQGTADI
ncbi:MAG: response regulator [Pseudobdellovibrionaceae bacterium]